MTIKTFSPGANNTLGLINIQQEFGQIRQNPVGRQAQLRLSDYYRYPGLSASRALVPNISVNNSIPQSGQISYSSFFGANTPYGSPNFSFPNASFEDGLVNWNALNYQIKLNGGSTILGWPTPTDPTPRPFNNGGSQSPGDVNNTGGGYNTSSTTASASPGGGGKSVLMTTGSHIVQNGAIIYGPALYSVEPILVNEGDYITFWYRAISDSNQSAGDAYNVFGYLLNPLSGGTITILDEHAGTLGYSTSWQQINVSFTAAQTGPYHFVFLCGSFDTTFGTVVGSALYIDNINLVKRQLLE